MSKNIVNIIFYFLLFLSFATNAQEAKAVEQVPSVQVMAKATKSEILLRWGVDTPLAWKYANEYGFIIEKHTIAVGTTVLEKPIIETLTPVPIKPKPVEEWEDFADRNQNAAIAAQAIYGDDFEVDLQQGGNDIVSIINQAQELEQRFSFALLAADQDFEVAKYSGLAYVDKDIKANERYLYKIRTAIPDEKLRVEPSGAYLGLEDYQPLPEPVDFVGIFNDKSALLSWNFVLLKKQYNNYILERSDNEAMGFSPLSNVPIANFNDNEKKPSSRMFYIDSLFQNDKKYYYRLKGISPFGEVGPPSPVISGEGKTPLLHNPAITETQLVDNVNVVIKWEFPTEGTEQLDHFELNRANEMKGNYIKVVDYIDKGERVFLYDKLEATNYFKITAVGKHGEERASFPAMVQPLDSIPPSTPLGLTGEIDSTGTVKLSWKRNAEIDFLGYRVFKANLENEEFVQITFRTVPEEKFVDTVSLKSLNSKVYYKIQAFDKRYNPSGFSEVLALKKPDIIPPTQAVFKSFRADEGKIYFNWINSSSDDVLKTLVYRKVKGEETPWALVYEAPLFTDEFSDNLVEPNVTYLYTLVVVDESGLESPPVTPLTITLPDNKVKPEIKVFNVIPNPVLKNIFLSWKYKEKDIKEFLLYKSEEENPPTLYKIFKENETIFYDNALKINTNYTYLLKAVFKSGAMSPVKKVTVKY